VAACQPGGLLADTQPAPTATTGAIAGAPSPTPDPAGAQPTGLPPEAVLDAQRWLANQLGLPVEQVQIVDQQQAEWTDSCLGLGGPAESCLAVITPGWLVMLAADGQTYEVRTDETGDTIRSATPLEGDALAGTSWRLETLTTPSGEAPVMGEAALTLAFDANGEVTGEGGCNQFGGQYLAEDGGLTISDIVQTERACQDQALMDQEQQYLSALMEATNFTIQETRDGTLLRLDTAAGPLVFAAAVSKPPAAPASALVPGILDFNAADSQPVVTAPENVVTGEDFEVTITTFGGGCEEAGPVSAIQTLDGATIFVYDETTATHPGVVCTTILKQLPHTVTLRFDEPGEKLLQIWGRRVSPEAGPLGEPTVIEHRIVVDDSAGT
jgi:heat shock protein HslJ